SQRTAPAGHRDAVRVLALRYPVNEMKRKVALGKVIASRVLVPRHEMPRDRLNRVADIHRRWLGLGVSVQNQRTRPPNPRSGLWDRCPPSSATRQPWDSEDP